MQSIKENQELFSENRELHKTLKDVTDRFDLLEQIIRTSDSVKKEILKAYYLSRWELGNPNPSPVHER